MSKQKERTLKVGSESQRGTVHLSAHTPGRLTLSASYKGERAATVLLTREQVRQLRAAIEALEPFIEAPGEQAEYLGTGLKFAA
jgi:hypothetical protein